MMCVCFICLSVCLSEQQQQCSAVTLLYAVLIVVLSWCCSGGSLPDHGRALQAVPPAGRLHRGRIPQLAVQLHRGLRLPLPAGRQPGCGRASLLHPNLLTLLSTRQMSAGSYCYLVFASICLSVAVYVYVVIPETKNKTFMEISRMFSRKEPVVETQGLMNGDQLRLKKMNGYGGVEHTSLEFDSSS